MRGRRVADGVRPDALFSQLRVLGNDSVDVSGDDVMNAEPRQRFSVAVKEHTLVVRLTAGELFKLASGRDPQRAKAYLVPLSVKLDKRLSYLGGVQSEIANCELSCFTGACSRVIHKQQQGAISGADPRGVAGCVKQGIDFVLFQVAHGHGGATLEHDRPDRGTPRQVFRTALSDESCQRMDRRQSLIPRRNATFSNLLDVTHELP